MCDLLIGPPKPSAAGSTKSATVCAADVEKRRFPEAFHTRTTFYVNHRVDPGSNSRLQPRSGQMYVEHLEPLGKMSSVPIILIHDDFQTGQIFLTKPDGNPGWASFFVRKGYDVYVPDLPYCGRSNYVASCDSPVSFLSREIIERELTATAKSEPGWKRSKLHDKWPGTGLRNDEVFENFCASLTPLNTKKEERESLAQAGLKALLERLGKALLLGVGSGAIAAWLAADAVPELVAGVVAIEPSGPPCGIAYKKDEGCGYRTYTAFTTPCAKMRKYGICDIPLTYSPPLESKDVEDGSAGFLMDISFVQRSDGLGSCARQNEIQCPAGWIDLGAKHHRRTGERCVRKLVHLQKMRHVVVTSHTSIHTNYDWATVNFLRDAGLDLHWMKLEERGVCGNGHLMFLEENSDQIASLIHQRMEKMVRVWDDEAEKVTNSAKRRREGVHGRRSNKNENEQRESSTAELGPGDGEERVKSESMTPMPSGTQRSSRSASLHQPTLPPLHHTKSPPRTSLAPSYFRANMSGALNVNVNELKSSPVLLNAEDELLYDFASRDPLSSAPNYSSPFFNLDGGCGLNRHSVPSIASSEACPMILRGLPATTSSFGAGNITSCDLPVNYGARDALNELFQLPIHDEMQSWEEVFADDWL